jgi:hypothetical protein
MNYDKDLRSYRMLSAEQRFELSHVKVPIVGCWLWLGAKHGSNGYGNIKVNGKTVMAHRYSFMRQSGIQEIPLNMVVMHICDTPLCVNPEHLRLGTQHDNEKDKVAKCRQAKGHALSAAQKKGWMITDKRPAHSVLTREQVANIRLSTDPQRVIAKKFGVSQTAIHNIKARKTHVNW